MSAELLELKKQTRIMARREANRAAGLGFAIGLLAGGFVFFLAPSEATMATVAIAPLVCAVVGYRLAMRRLT